MMKCSVFPQRCTLEQLMFTKMYDGVGSSISLFGRTMYHRLSASDKETYLLTVTDTRRCQKIHFLVQALLLTSSLCPPHASSVPAQARENLLVSPYKPLIHIHIRLNLPILTSLGLITSQEPIRASMYESVKWGEGTQFSL